MKLSRNQGNHVRFEPAVDNGTTYAFNYARDQLVIGRENLYRLYESVGEEGRSVAELIDQLVAPRNDGQASYPSELELLVDITRLVDARVLNSRVH